VRDLWLSPYENKITSGHVLRVRPAMRALHPGPMTCLIIDSVGFEVLTAATMKKSAVLWDATPCSSRAGTFLGGTYRLQLHDHHESACRLRLLVSCLAYSSAFKTEAICSSERSASLRTTRFYSFFSGSQMRHQSVNEYRK
jgi:hypothetical protein